MSTNKNAYEIRADILAMAKEFIEFQYSSKWNSWYQEVVNQNDHKDDIYLDATEMPGMPEIPSIDDVVYAAEKFYSFVNDRKG